MYTINNDINISYSKALNVKKLIDVSAKEVLLIALQKDTIFPKHTSPVDAHILVLHGEITFFINSEHYHVKQYQIFNFPSNEEHWVEAKTDAKFLIIR